MRRETPAEPPAPVGPDADAAGFAAARAVCRRHAPDVFPASYFLPKDKRDAAFAAFAFCRMVADAMTADDRVIEASRARALREHPVVAVGVPRAAGSLPTEVGGPDGRASSSCCSDGSDEARLRLFRERLDEIYDGRLELPSPAARSEAQHALHAFAQTVGRHEIPKQHFLDLAEGHRADRAVSRYATWASLERHCRGVGGVVGAVVACVLGLTHSDAGAHAVRLGNAVRLTSILRDVRADRDRGRVYLPLEDMAGFRYSERDLAAGTVNEPFRALMRFELERARRMYDGAAEGLRWVAGDAPRLAVAAVAVTHAGLLDAIERQGYDVFANRVQLTTGQKLRRLPAAWRLARRAISVDRALPLPSRGEGGGEG